MEAAQRHACEPAYAPVPLVLPPRIWPCLLLSVLLVLGDALLTLLWFSQTTPTAGQQQRFWIYALLPGCLLAGLAVSLRLAWYALWRLFCAVQQHTQAQHHAWWLAFRQETACVYQSLLWGPVCHDMGSRDKLARDVHTDVPRATAGVLRMADILSAAQASAQQRLDAILLAFAKELVAWLHSSPIRPRGFAWCGSGEDWVALRQLIQSEGLSLPEKPDMEGGMAMLEYMIDRLHDEALPANAILCMGVHAPTRDDSRTEPAGESAFALLLGRGGKGIQLHRPVPLSSHIHVQRAQDNAALDAPPDGYLTANSKAAPLLDEANWQRINNMQEDYWGKQGSHQAWITLLCAIDRVTINETSIGWFAEENDAAWLGIVTQAPLTEGHE
jgi:hypothetical protein